MGMGLNWRKFWQSLANAPMQVVDLQKLFISHWKNIG